MKLLTKEIEKKFLKYPLYSQEGLGVKSKVLVKYFNPCGVQTWLVTEAQKTEDGDWELFAYCQTAYGWEWGYLLLSQLESLKLPLGLTVERDLYIGGDCTVEELAR